MTGFVCVSSDRRPACPRHGRAIVCTQLAQDPPFVRMLQFNRDRIVATSGHAMAHARVGLNPHAATRYVTLQIEQMSREPRPWRQTDGRHRHVLREH